MLAIETANDVKKFRVGFVKRQNVAAAPPENVGLELERQLAGESQRLLSELGYDDAVEIHAADARAGWPSGAPYNRILVSFATPEIFPEWTQQLANPGILLAPVGPARGQVLRRLRRSRDGDRLEDGPGCIFVSLATAATRPK